MISNNIKNTIIVLTRELHSILLKHYINPDILKVPFYVTFSYEGIKESTVNRRKKNKVNSFIRSFFPFQISITQLYYLLLSEDLQTLVLHCIVGMRLRIHFIELVENIIAYLSHLTPRPISVACFATNVNKNVWSQTISQVNDLIHRRLPTTSMWGEFHLQFHLTYTIVMSSFIRTISQTRN